MLRHNPLLRAGDGHARNIWQKASLLDSNRIGKKKEVPDAERFKKAVEIASNADLYWQTFTNPDGSPNRTLFLESIMYALDKQSILMAAMNQAKNATIKAQLPDNSQGGLVRQIPQSQEPNELDKYMHAALAGYGPFK